MDSTSLTMLNYFVSGCQWYVQCTINGFGTQGFCNDNANFDDGFCDVDNPCNVQAARRWREQCYPSDENQLIVHPHSCEVFISCQQGQPQVTFCPEGELVNPIDAICDPRELVTCENTLPPDLDGDCIMEQVGSFFPEETSKFQRT